MPRDPAPTRTAIMDAAESLVLDAGFSATSVDKVIEKAGITKGTFFYHFKTKNDLALALVERYAAKDEAHLDAAMTRAAQLSRDPLQQVLIFIGLLREELAELTAPIPGCLYASYCYESQLFTDETLKVIRQNFADWRERFGGLVDEAAALYPPRFPIEGAALADMFIVIFEGSLIVSKTLGEPDVVARQLEHYRNYIELLFAKSGTMIG